MLSVIQASRDPQIVARLLVTLLLIERNDEIGA
jgi:hypothetical protein